MDLIIYVKLIMFQGLCYETHLIYPFTDPFNPHDNDRQPETHTDEVTVSYRIRFLNPVGWSCLVLSVL